MIKQIHKVTETKPTSLLKDFNTFISFLSEKPTELGKYGNLPREVVYQLNQLMSIQAKDVTQNNDQDLYPLLHMFFHLALAGKLFSKEPGKAGKSLLIPNERIQLYKELTTTEKYFFLLETFWLDIKWPEIYVGHSPRSINPVLVIRILKVLLKSGYTGVRDLLRGEFSLWGYFLLYFSYFGFWDVVKDEEQHRRLGTKKTFFAESVTLNEFGKKILGILNTKRNLLIWNIPWRRLPEREYLLDLIQSGAELDAEEKMFKEAFDKLGEPFFLAFRNLFPEGELEKTLPRELPKFKDGIYTFKVSLDKKIWRKINTSAHHTLDDLHNVIQDAFDFDNDHLYAFYMDGKKWSDDAYNSPHDSDGPFADKIKIGDLALNEGDSFLYLFDFGDEWEFQVVFEKIQPEEVRLLKPVIIESKGEEPEQYPQYEDDWDDCDEDWDEEN